MVKLLIYQLVILFTLLLVKPLTGFAGERILSDTVPDLKKPVPEQPDVKKVAEKPLDIKKDLEQPLDVKKEIKKLDEQPLDVKKDVKKLDVIKEVPKSRRKLKPIAIPAPVPVKPIKIIKPKIIRRVI